MSLKYAVESTEEFSAIGQEMASTCDPEKKEETREAAHLQEKRKKEGRRQSRNIFKGMLVINNGVKYW